jgi:hypothetical protein
LLLPPSSEVGTVTRTSTKAAHHPDYDPITLQNDIAVIAMASIEKYIDNSMSSIAKVAPRLINCSADRIALTKLPMFSNNNYTGLRCNVSGWGLNKSPLEG